MAMTAEKQRKVGDNVIEVRGLSIEFRTPVGPVHALRNINFDIPRGSVVGLVGESGSGKSTLALAIMGLMPENAVLNGGSIRFGDIDLRALRPAALKALRGDRISMVFQDPMTSLNPVRSIGNQMTDIQYRDRASMAEKRRKAADILRKVGIPDPESQLDRYAHAFSGGMRQRIVIAMGILERPELLIADEPTTALDVTIQAQILELIGDLQQRLGLSVLLITHDLGVVAEMCDRVAVMYSGKIVELAPAADLYRDPGHPYTAGLLRSTPRLDIVIPRLVSIDGSPPDLVNPPSGCAFAARCALAIEQCLDATPGLRVHSPSRRVACWRPFQAPFENLSVAAVADGSSSDASGGTQP
jgi:oligopeptide/dipeptide ABC transporter ATP-binding protein